MQGEDFGGLSPGPYLEAGRRADVSEQAGFRPGHPDLASARGEAFEQGGSAARVEVGGNLVEEEDRAAAGLLGDEIGMGEDDREEQRLLLARRA
jgi:hypothetical protein